MNIAQLRFQPSSPRWTLYWADRNSRWHRYDDVDPATDLDAVIAEIDSDPHLHLLRLNPRSHRRRSLLHHTAASASRLPSRRATNGDS
jgi:Protein of unknown function (DUF3024)